MRSHHILTVSLATLLAAGSTAFAEGRIRITTVDGTGPAARADQDTSGVTLASGAKVEARDRQRGEVLINVQDADLTTVVLPLFYEQAGVSIRYRGAPKKLTLRLVHPVAWEDALEIVCQFTQTHAATDRHGRLVLRKRYGGQGPDEEPVLVARKVERSVAASAPRTTLPEPPNIPRIRIGNPNGVARFGGGNARRVGPRRVGPRRVGPRRVGPRRVGTKRRAGPRRTTPRRQGPRRPLPGF